MARRIYRSESFSWINRRNGETHTVEVGDKGRSAIKQVLEVCGFSVHESSATPTAAADLLVTSPLTARPTSSLITGTASASAARTPGPSVD